MSECAREGCRREVPRAALLAGDPFCSAVCCRAAHGMSVSADELHGLRWAGVCKGCGCPRDEQTPGCVTCHNRHLQRAQKAKAA